MGTAELLMVSVRRTPWRPLSPPENHDLAGDDAPSQEAHNWVWVRPLERAAALPLKSIDRKAKLA